MRIILGLAAPDAGTASVGGEPYVRKPFPLREVGTLLDASDTHPGRRARDHLRWLAESNDIPRSRVAEVLELVGLADVGGRRTGGFSLGMAQRLVPLGRARDTHQRGDLAHAELVDTYAEVVPRGTLHAVDPVAEVDAVEVERDDPLVSQILDQPRREASLDHLSPPGVRAAERLRP